MRKFHKTIDQRMFDFQDFYCRMADTVPDVCRIAEVGVANGASAIYLAETLLDLKKSFRFVLIDSLAYGGADQLNELLRNVGAAGLGGVVEILPKDSLTASCQFPDNYFDFVFIDASHKYEETKADIRLWWQKVKPGAILAGHDYNDDEGKWVKQAVDEVIPKEFINALGQELEQAERVLWTEETPSKYGLWYVQRNPRFKLCY